jgi:hypothetical protein
MQRTIGTPILIKQVNANALSKAIDAIAHSNPSGLLILCCDEGTNDRASFDPILKASSIPIFGGIFPGLIYQGNHYDHGMLVVPMYTPLQVVCVENISEGTHKNLNSDFSMQKFSSLLVLIDGLTRGIGTAINQILDDFGQSIKVFGGGAGSLSFEQKPCLFTPQGVSQDAMVLVAMKQDWALAVGHGWEVFDGPFIANKVDDNRVLELNFEPAFDVYKQVIEKFDGREINSRNFFEIAKTYPFGLERLDEDVLVRDPITVDDSALTCVGEVRENSMLYMLKGESEKLMAAATNAITKVSKNQTIEAGFIFDCISRKLFLGDDFVKEVEIIANTIGEDAVLFGVLALGEIASDNSGSIELHNKTAVTALAKGVQNSS